MPEPQPTYIGPAYAWQDAGRWFFTPYRFRAPADAIEVQRIAIGVEIVLEEDVGAGASRFIYDAEQVD
jgi:hypothetical protein